MCQLSCFVIMMYVVKHYTELWVIVRICHPDRRQMLDYLALWERQIMEIGSCISTLVMF